MSSPGAEEGKDLDRTLETFLLVTVGTSQNTGHSVLQGGAAWAREKWSIRVSLTFSGESASGSDGNLGVRCPVAIRLAFQTVW